MISTLNKLTDGTIEITLNVPWLEVDKIYQEVINKILSQTELPGFRKGKAPPKLAEKKFDKSKIYEEVLKILIPKVYNEAISEQKIRPVVTPKIELKEATEKKDWVIKAITCEKPKIDLGDYKKAVIELNHSKKHKIWVPGQSDSKTKEGKPDQAKTDKPSIDEILKALYNAVKVTLPAILTDHETNRLLAELIDETKKLGLTVEQYLASTGRSADKLRQEYAEQAKRTLILEFVLEEIADKEEVLVSDDDINAVIKTAKNDAERETLGRERYYLASILRRQKTLDFLANLY